MDCFVHHVDLVCKQKYRVNTIYQRAESSSQNMQSVPMKRFRQTQVDEYPELRKVKRRKSSETLTEWITFRDVVLRFSVLIVENLKISGALFPWLIVPTFRYLTPNQLKTLMSLPTERKRADRLLLDLRCEHCDRISFRKFVASLYVEEEHKGHHYIVDLLKDALPLADWREIQCVAEEGRSPQRAYSSTNIKEIVLSLSPEICRYVSVKALIAHFCIPEHSFISDYQLKYLSDLPTEENAAEELLLILDREKQPSFYKFVACLCNELEHSGHREIVECLIETIQATEKMEAPRLLVHIELQGDIVSKEFAKIDQKFWMTFENKEYGELIKQTQEILLDSTASTDRKIVASCFEAVARVHQGKLAGNFRIAITQLLLPALKLCEKSENGIILQGRVCQRLAQIYLQMKRPALAEHYFGIAKWYLFFAGRGFDKCKMLCREAKLLAVSAPEKRTEIEGLFDAALDNISGDEPYAKTCKESVLLSKAALCLNISFGTARNNFICKQVTPDDFSKARKILSSFEKERVKGNMRECEFKLLTAELLRLEAELLRQAEGNVDQECMLSFMEEAVTGFRELINRKTKKLNRNIVDIARHRCHILNVLMKSLSESTKG